MNIKKPRNWNLKDALATPEGVFANRREFLAGMGLGISGLAAAVVLLGQDGLPVPSLYPVPRNSAFKLDRTLTAETVNAKWNNFYEFGSHKEISKAAQALKLRPWMVKFDGLVEKPFELGFDDLLAKMKLEERLYRHRCVEAWSMTIPWSGFPMKDLVALAKPLSSAKYVRMETFFNPAVAPGQKQTWNPWPYVEGLTIEEATNELAFMVTGAYGKPVAKQHGAPLRLAVPWKYGFKNIKSITRFSFVAERPVSFWEKILPAEYGFWANINPDVPHPRWSQATERVLGTETRVPTLPYNGYGEQVAHLYKDRTGEKLLHVTMSVARKP
jgi:sulfoxide reductase catalytic subunit YedY